jgi:hypothetical protein
VPVVLASALAEGAVVSSLSRLSRKELWQNPPGAVARPTRTADSLLVVGGTESEVFDCPRCQRVVAFRMPARGPHRETPKIEFTDDPLTVPACGRCSRDLGIVVILVPRNPGWRMEISERCHALLALVRQGIDVTDNPTLLVRHV